MRKQITVLQKINEDHISKTLDARRETVAETLTNMGVFGTCTCGGDVVYYANRGVMCHDCGKLYGVWYYRRGKPKPMNHILTEERRLHGHSYNE
jgi:hypothetical protein